ncbi:phosphonoacetaldehyde reductase [Metabacillus fastidiosus]|uniref:phosphonoacetaldehyde reductase n=1 Tax=Metabacillus fastidiosus TaxID=1458 RepID=UPI003D275113
MNKLLSNEIWSYRNPVNIVAGIGVLNNLKDLIPKGKVLLITTAGFTERGVTDQVKEKLLQTTILVYDKVTPNPELTVLEEMTKEFKTMGICSIIALGGGSVMDTAKVLSVTLPSDLEYPLDEVLIQQKSHIWKTSLPVIAVPTTSGSGAEVTPFATVWDTNTHKKYSVTGEHLYPIYALLDPLLTMSLSYQQTLFTALDAISHSLESIWNKNRTSVSESFAVQALVLANEALPKLLEYPNDKELRARMQQASVLAGLAISQTRTAIAHSISYPLTMHLNIPHGLASSFTLSEIIKSNWDTLSENIYSNVIKTTEKMLENLNLSNEITKYATSDQILMYVNEMFTPERAGNYINAVSNGDINSLLKRSISSDTSTKGVK